MSRRTNTNSPYNANSSNLPTPLPNNGSSNNYNPNGIENLTFENELNVLKNDKKELKYLYI